MEVSKNWKILPNLESSLPELLTAQCPSSLPSFHSIFFADCLFQVNFTVRMEIRQPIEVGHLQKLWGKLLLIKESLRNEFSCFSYLYIGRSLLLIHQGFVVDTFLDWNGPIPLIGSKCDPTPILGSIWGSAKRVPNPQSLIFSHLKLHYPVQKYQTQL